MYVVGEDEIEAIARVIRSGKLFRYGIGHECERFEERYAAFLGVNDVGLAGSGTAALTAGLIGLGIGPGDEVVVPAHTYMATALAVLSAGAIPVLVDIDETLTISPAAIEAAITANTRAVIPVHLWGTAADMDSIMAIAKKHGLLVIEDACQGVGGGYKGRKMGSIGDAGAYSFNYYKNMSCGEGGCVVSNDPDVMQRARCAIDPTAFYWTGRADGFKPFSSNGVRANEIQGAMLNVQLDRLPNIVEAMRVERNAVLAGTAHLHDLGLKQAPLHSPQDDAATHAFFSLPSAEAVERFISVYPVPVAGLTGRHMYTGWDQILLQSGAHHAQVDPYKLPANEGLGVAYTKDSFPTTLDIAGRTLMIPMDPEHTAEQTRNIIHNMEVAARVAVGELSAADADIREITQDVDLQKWDMKETVPS